MADWIVNLRYWKPIRTGQVPKESSFSITNLESSLYSQRVTSKSVWWSGKHTEYSSPFCLLLCSFECNVMFMELIEFGILMQWIVCGRYNIVMCCRRWSLFRHGSHTCPRIFAVSYACIHFNSEPTAQGFFGLHGSRGMIFSDQSQITLTTRFRRALLIGACDDIFVLFTFCC